jgi:hypothetical protein
MVVVSNSRMARESTYPISADLNQGREPLNEFNFLRLSVMLIKKILISKIEQIFPLRHPPTENNHVTFVCTAGEPNPYNTS